MKLSRHDEISRNLKNGRAESTELVPFSETKGLKTRLTQDTAPVLNFFFFEMLSLTRLQ